ncbi:MAG: NPCBM/NEW2 domain-containing protein [Kiritimatiellia bacterium]
MDKAACCLALATMALAGVAENRIWLEDLDRSSMTCSYRTPLVARSVEGGLLAIKGKTYARGLGTHANSSLTVPVGGNALRFVADAGLDDEVKGRPKASVEFKVWGDGRLLATSGVLRKTKRLHRFDVDLAGVQVVVLEVSDAGDGNDSDHADWAEAFFAFKDGTGPVKPAELTRQLGVLTPPAAAAPRINGPSVFGVRPGHPILFRVPVSGERPVAITVSDLPAGAYFDAARQSINGAVQRPGTYEVRVEAKNAKGRATRTLALVVGDRIALTPPMGWNSWNAFGGNVSAQKVEAAAEAMVASGLADHGWSYVNIDDFWQNRPGEKADGPARNADGSIGVNARFPSMAELAESVHARGLRIGLYSSPGPLTCGGCAGSWRHEFQDAATYAAWGYDYLKYDWCSYDRVAIGGGLDRLRLPYLLMGQALRAQNRDIVFSLCQYGMGNVSCWGESVHGQCWRTTGDVFDNWGSIYGSIQHQQDLWYWSRPGAWNDPDMLCVGRMRWNGFAGSRLTPNEQYSHLSLWCLVGAPLMIGCDLTRLDDFTFNLLANDEVLAVDQDPLGAGAAKIGTDGFGEIWARPLADGSVAVGLLNAGLATADIAFDLAAYGLEGTWNVRDLWRQKDEPPVRGVYKATVFGHATQLVRLTPGADGRLAEGFSDIRENAWRRLIGQKRPVAPARQEASAAPCGHCAERKAGR